MISSSYAGSNIVKDDNAPKLNQLEYDIDESLGLIKRTEKETNSSNSDSNNKIRFVLMSDTHQFHKEVPKELKGNVLLHAGDFTKFGYEKHVKNFNEYLKLQREQFEYIIVIFGNHEDPILQSCDYDIDLLHKTYLYNATHVLFDNSITLYNKIKIHGTSYKNKKENDFPFRNYPIFEHEKILNKLELEKYKLIPKDVNILISHKPPCEVLDGGFGGSLALKHALNTFDLCDLKLLLFGHVHDSYGTKVVNILKDKKQFLCVNAAMNRVNIPFYFDYYLNDNNDNQNNNSDNNN
ncbi:hypothetical protein ABK040_000737 [Willaertia magna]